MFDVNKLDLVKVGKSFGFSVPPRVNLNIAPGSGVTEKKRKRKGTLSDDSDVEMEELKPVAEDEQDEDEDAEVTSRAQGRMGKQRRIETLGKKQVDREVYRRGREQKRQKESGQQWSR